MRITVDRGSDTVHLRLAEGEGEADARALADGVSVDYDGAGRLVGLTIRGVSRLTGAADATSTLVVDLGGHAPAAARSAEPAAATPTMSPPAAQPRMTTPPSTPGPAAEPAPAPDAVPAPFPAVAATPPSPPSQPASPPEPAPSRNRAAVARPSKLLPLSMAERASLGPLTWEPDAEEAMARVPFFQRGGARIAVVEAARARRLSVVTAALVQEMAGR